MTRLSRLTVLLVTLALVPVAAAADSPPFTLGKAVPADVFIYVHGAYNPEGEYLRKYWEDVWSAFKKTGVIKDVHKLIGSNLTDEQRSQFEDFWKRAEELIGGVDWDARIHEGVYAARMNPPMPEHLVLLRYDADKAAKNAQAFAAVLEEIAKTVGKDDGAGYATSESHGAKIWTLSFKQAPFLNARVAVRGEVVAVALDRGMLDESLAMLAGESDKKALVQTERFRNAAAKLPPPEDAVTFFDVRAMMDGVQAMLKYAGEQAKDDKDAQEILRILGKVVNEARLVDYLAGSVRTEGHRQIDETIAVLAPDAEKSRLYKAFCRPKPIERFDRFIPKEAGAYSVSSGIDFSALYAAVLDFIREEVPQGKELLARYEKTLEEVDFNPERDIFAWLGEQMVSVNMPAATPNPFSPTDWVWFIQVRNEKQAAEKVQAGVDKLNNLLARFNQSLTSRPAEIEGAKDFRSVTHPMLAMFLNPVYGVADGFLIIGSSSEAIGTCLATARGEHPGVSRNERVMREGLIPKGPVTGASFQDLTGMGKNIAQALASLNFVSAMMQANPDTKPAADVIGILAKLSPVAMKIDFLVSQSSMSTFDGKVWHMTSVMNYRPPKAKQAESDRPGGS